MLIVTAIASACVTATREAGDPALGAPGSPASDAATPTTGPASATGEPGVAPSSLPATPYRSAELSLGYIALDGSQTFVQGVSAGIRDAAAAAGVDLVECDAGWTRQGVRACADELARAGVHGVISFQPFADLAGRVCEATGDAPTIGVVYDQGPCQVSLLQVDQADSGRLAGAALGRFAAERFDCDVAAFLSLESTADDPIGSARMAGYRTGYEEHCPLPAETRTLSGAQHVATARTQVAAQLDEIEGSPILVAAVSELAVMGAMEAAVDAGREQEVWYSGQLADPGIRRTIACDGQYVASVAHLPERFGPALVPVLLEAIEGRGVPSRVDAELQLVTAEDVRQLFPDTPACNE